MHNTNNFIKYSYLEKISWRKEFKGRLQSVCGTALTPKELTGKQPLEVILSSGSKDLYMELNSFPLLSLFTPIPQLLHPIDYLKRYLQEGEDNRIVDKSKNSSPVWPRIRISESRRLGPGDC